MMNITKETELIHAVIVYCQRCRDEGDYSALNEMGFGPLETKALTNLTSTDKLRLASVRSHFLNIELQRKLYWRMIDYISREKERDAIVKKLIANDAPMPMMHSLTGMGSRQYSFLRRESGLQTAKSGRPHIPSQEICDQVWAELKRVVSNSKDFGPKEFLVLYESLNAKISLRVIWYLFHRWEEDGKLKVHRTDAPPLENHCNQT